MHFICMTEPVGKPRMTQRDKWMKRKCVVRYRAFADELRRAAGKGVPCNAHTIAIRIFFSFPKSYSLAARSILAGLSHAVKPDASNVLKGVEDILFKNDSQLSDVRCQKFWDDGNGARVEVQINE